MSFQLKKFQKVASEESSGVFKKNIIVGNHSLALSLYYQFLQEADEQDVVLISSPALSSKDLRVLGPGLFRDKNRQTDALFFKDMKFYGFGGRIKSQKLSPYEEFFLSPPIEPMNRSFPCLDDSRFMDNLKKKCLNYIPSCISYSRNNYIIKCTNSVNLECQNLYWMGGPRPFLNLYSGEKCSSLVQLCNPKHSPASLYVRYLFERPITDKKETLFFPLSYSRPQGHFIGEFRECEVEFVTFINTKDIHEEDIAGKIRVLNRHLGKAFPDFKTTSYQKFIHLTEYSPLLDIEHDWTAKIQKDLPGLYFHKESATAIPSLNSEGR